LKQMEVTNALAYCDAANITNKKSF
jgi:hypothetical protein